MAKVLALYFELLDARAKLTAAHLEETRARFVEELEIIASASHNLNM